MQHLKMPVLPVANVQCLERNNQESILSAPVPENTWQFTSQDLFQFGPSCYLVTVDHCSDYIEVQDSFKYTPSTVVLKLKAVFCRHGVP